jgi:hypothetical protein
MPDDTLEALLADHEELKRRVEALEAQFGFGPLDEPDMAALRQDVSGIAGRLDRLEAYVRSKPQRGN